MKGPVLPSERIVDALEAVIVSGDSNVLEGDNQKQADFLSRSLVKVNPGKLHDLHLIISSISRPEHITRGHRFGDRRRWRTWNNSLSRSSEDHFEKRSGNVDPNHRTMTIAET